MEKNDSKIVRTLWNDSSFSFIFDKEEDTLFLDDCVFNDELFAIYHKTTQKYEFIFLPLSKKIERSFEYIYQGHTYKLYYGKPTENFRKLLSHFEMNEIDDISDRAYSLMNFDIFYSKAEESALTPINFFVEGDFDKIPFEEHLAFFKHVNFMMSYYDRKTPTILIFNKKKNNVEDESIIEEPCKLKTQTFPKIINGNKIDTTLLELYEAARSANSVRLQYIFYYQILEYCSYYYIENDLKRKIANIVKNPDILNTDMYSQKIIEIYSEYFRSNKEESKRMERLICDFCEYNDIKQELETNSKSFIEDICFDGGLVIKGIFNKKEDIDNPPKEVLPSIRKNVEKIRNVLVHAREARENVVITPTQRNSYLLGPYLFLLRRIAELVMIRYE